MIFWDDLEMLRKSVPALRSRVDRLVMVDGPYARFPKSANPVEFWPSDVTRSADGSNEYAREHADSVVEGHWLTEEAKRTAYLMNARLESDIIVVDADEILEGEFPYETPELARIEIRRTDGIPPYPIFRAFKNRLGLRYEGTHCTVWDGDILLNSVDMPVLSGCWLKHLNPERNKVRIELKSVYYAWLQTHENPYKAWLRTRGIIYEA